MKVTFSEILKIPSTFSLKIPLKLFFSCYFFVVVENAKLFHFQKFFHLNFFHSFLVYFVKFLWKNSWERKSLFLLEKFSLSMRILEGNWWVFAASSLSSFIFAFFVKIRFSIKFCVFHHFSTIFNIKTFPYYLKALNLPSKSHSHRTYLLMLQTSTHVDINTQEIWVMEGEVKEKTSLRRLLWVENTTWDEDTEVR